MSENIWLHIVFLKKNKYIYTSIGLCWRRYNISQERLFFCFQPLLVVWNSAFKSYEFDGSIVPLQAKCIPFCKAKIQYLLTCKVSIYCSTVCPLASISDIDKIFFFNILIRFDMFDNKYCIPHETVPALLWLLSHILFSCCDTVICRWCFFHLFCK